MELYAAKFFESIRNAVLAPVLITLAGCASPIKTFVDFDQDSDFSAYQTYSFMSENPMLATQPVRQAAGPFLESKIQNAIREELDSRGYRELPVGARSDFVVSFAVGARKDIQVDAYPVVYRSGWRWGGAYFGEESTLTTTTRGALSIDLFDGSRKAPTWHGRATKSLTPADQQLRTSVIQDVVSEIFKPFPPLR